MTDELLIVQVSRDDLLNDLLSGVEAIFEKNFQTNNSSKEYFTCKEVQDFLKISGVTRWQWTKKGILQSYKVGSRLRYRKDDVLNALHKIESKKSI